MAAGQIAIHTGFRGMCSCPVTACTGGTNAVGDAFHRIRDGYETAMVCGGAESCISLWHRRLYQHESAFHRDRSGCSQPAL